VTDAEILDHEENEKKFKADESQVEYVLIADKASKEDEAEVKAKNHWFIWKCCLQSSNF
jgi:peptidyl-prolyl cis-trans isomerase D